MSKKSKEQGDGEVPTIKIDINDLDTFNNKLKRIANKSDEPVKPLEFIKAIIKDEFCNYSYKINIGVGAGNTHNVIGKGHIISMDLQQAFFRLNIHLAIIDDVFKHANFEISDPGTLGGHELATLYVVDGFTVKGTTEDLSAVLEGYKYTTQGMIELKTPKIVLVGVGGYDWKQHLKDAVDKVREEVELYHNGKYTELEPEEKQDPAQTSLFDENTNDKDYEFENARQ